MTTTYAGLRADQRDKINGFPIRFAFSNQQLDEVIKELGPAETLVNIGGGGFLRKSDRQAFDDLFESCEREMAEAMLNDDFLLDAMKYELGNHEYCITFDPSSTIDALGLDMTDERTVRLLNVAKREYLKEYREWEAAQE